MKKRAVQVAFLAVFLAAMAAAPLHAQTFPDRPVKLIIAYPPGGPTDTVARILTAGIAEHLGQPMIVENVAGAGGRIGARDVARAAPDGYTLLLGGSNDNGITAVVYSNLDYDPVKDFVPVSAVATDSNALVVNPELPVQSLAELVSYTKANPGKVTAGATMGIAPHLMIAFIQARTGADMLFVPYKGGAPAIADVLGNHIQVNVSAKSVLLPHIKAGKLRALAVSSAERWPELPDVPTLHESGIDGFPNAVWFTVMAPAATPPAVLVKLNEAINLHILSEPVREGIRKIGLEPHVLAPEVLTKKMADEAALWQGVARATGVHLE